MEELINKNTHMGSIIMYDEKLAYKYFTYEKKSVLNNKDKKLIMLMDRPYLKHAAMPRQLLFKDGKFCGYAIL